MTWIRVESSVARNRKFVKAGPAAAWLWICGLAYCQEGLTDGFIPREALDYLGVKNACRLATQLVLAHLWDCVEDGWNVHDYLDHNRSSDDVSSIRQARREAGANGGRASGEARRMKQTAKQTGSKPEATVEANLKQPSNPSTATSTSTTTATERDGAEPPSDSPPFLEFCTVGAGSKTWTLTVAHVNEWRQVFPGLDVADECWRASAWVNANPTKRKTAKGMPAFLVNWLNRAVERGGQSNGNGHATKTPAGQQPTYTGWDCDHLDRCANREMCHNKRLLGTTRYPVHEAAAP